MTSSGAAALSAAHNAIGEIVSFAAASASIEELEETAKLHLLLQGLKTRTLTDLQVRDVEETFSS